MNLEVGHSYLVIFQNNLNNQVNIGEHIFGVLIETVQLKAF